MPGYEEPSTFSIAFLSGFNGSREVVIETTRGKYQIPIRTDCRRVWPVGVFACRNQRHGKGIRIVSDDTTACDIGNIEVTFFICHNTVGIASHCTQIADLFGDLRIG